MKSKSEIKKDKNKSSPLYVKVLIPMILLAFLQLAIFLSVLTFGGEFSVIKKYAYDLLTEKTDNRASYLENELNQKTSIVYETSEVINSKVQQVLKDNNKKISAIRHDKKLNQKIISETYDPLVTMLRRNNVNDAFIILDTGNLYMDKDGNNKLTGFYIRDNDISSNENADNKDLLLEMGSSQVAHEKGLALDYEWSFTCNLDDDNNYNFFYNPIEAYKNSESPKVYNCGYWSGFSKISHSAQKSIKYTLPLVTDDGKIYGVIGIGILDNVIQSLIPSNDFIDESACYVLGIDDSKNGYFTKQTHTGTAYERLVSKDTVLNENNKEEYNLFSFNTRKESIGSIHQINIYKSDSPFSNQHWALVSIADKSEILSVYTKLIALFIFSSIITLCLNIVFSIVLTKKLTNPVSKIIKTLENGNKENDLIKFKSTHVTEIDKLANLIDELQVNVREQSSRVSNIISMANAGIGVFMYDFSNKNVFIGKSLLQMLRFDKFSNQNDVTVSFDDFKNYVDSFDEKHLILNSSLFSSSESNSSSESIELHCNNNVIGSKWFKFTMSKENKNIIGVVQDITKNVIERKKIEYERDYDITTGLYNRRAFHRKVNKLFNSPQKLGVGAFIMWDLDNLKFVNDTYGHDFGDDYIKTAANGLKIACSNDTIISRLSGDEFIVFIYNRKDKEELRREIASIRESVLNNYCILSDGTRYKIRISAGVSWYPDNAKTPDLLIKYADFAMYQIKHSTKGNIAEFNNSSYNSDSILVNGIEEMNRIIDDVDIRYAFQTIISAKTGSVYGYEALMRPNSDTITSPGEFIRIAKSSARLYEIERLTWFVALDNYQKLLNKKIVNKDTKLFINSIANCILEKRSIDQIEYTYKDILKNIVLEILESEQSNKEYAERKKKYISDWNGLIALDDFGTGYNSEYALLTLNPNIIKIDHSIINGCDHDLSRITIIENLITIAHNQNIMVLAEGVETYGELKSVIKCGVDLIQGFYISNPLYEPKPVDKKIVDQIIDINKNM